MNEEKLTPEEEFVTAEFPTESVYEIGGTRFIVTAHYDDNGEDLKTKIEKLLKKEVAKMGQSTIFDELKQR